MTDYYRNDWPNGDKNPPQQGARDSSLRQAVARRLYLAMPGAEMPPSDDRGLMWGEVEDTEHYRFCYEIADLINY